MTLSKKQEVLHYPNLKTILMVENILKNAGKAINRVELKSRLSTQVMPQTLNVILNYLEDKGIIIDSPEGILWIYNPSHKLKKEIQKGIEI